MTVETFYASSSIDIYGRNLNYSVARATSTGTDASPFIVGQVRGGGLYMVYRGFVIFDTSSIPDDAVISSVVFQMQVGANYSDTDFDIYINEQNFGSNREASYDDALSATSRFLWRNTSGMATATWYDTGAMTNSYVSKTSQTRYSIISSRDINANAPSGNEYIQTQTNLLRLVVTYTLPSLNLPIIWWS